MTIYLSVLYARIPFDYTQGDKLQGIFRVL